MWKGPPLDDVVEECRKKQNTSGELYLHTLNGLQTAIQTDGYSALNTSSLKYHLLRTDKGTIPKIFHFMTASFILNKKKRNYKPHPTPFMMNHFDDSKPTIIHVREIFMRFAKASLSRTSQLMSLVFCFLDNLHLHRKPVYLH